MAQQVEIQVAYAIGHPLPTSFWVNTFGSGNYPDAIIARAVEAVFSFKPMDMIAQLDLLHPIYRSTTLYGHFTKPELPWEQTNRIHELRQALASFSPLNNSA
ncbi:MAG: hypothetical protein B7X06_01395 [Verrucomicrobia bacterium 21-51-4]|nr:MAG: hypothetical protein B7X06_01395 [Verrucomicrobia bacterium 21-51-4]